MSMPVEDVARMPPDVWPPRLLPNEPRIPDPARQAVLTASHLSPHLSALEACLLTVRRQLDPELKRQQPVKLGKPYPLGQCLEIALAVQKRLRVVKEASLSGDAAVGLRALRVFQRAGGDFRQVWGDLRGMYFQNAFQVGTLYVDVANDTVTPTKPKVEILPFNEAQFIPIRDYRHFGQITRIYWQHEVYPNHVLPELAPHCPLIFVSPDGQFRVQNATQYMLAMTRSKAFAPSEEVLSEAPMPEGLFERIRRGLQESGYKLPQTPEHGRTLAMQNCRQQRAKRWHLEAGRVGRVIQEVMQVNQLLARRHQATLTRNRPSQEKPMPIIKIDNVEYDFDTLSDDAKARLASIQFVDQELVRLQAQVAAMQNARNAYVKALKAALPVVAGGDTIKFS